MRRNGTDRATPVVVLKLAEDPLAHGALGIIRSLGRLGLSVHVLSAGDWTALERSRFVAGGARLPAELPSAEVVDIAARYADGLGSRPLLICVGDVSALFLEEHADELSTHYRFPRNPSGLALRVADKFGLACMCADRRIPTPRTVRPANVADALTFADEVGLPIMVKSADPRRIDWAGGEVSVAKAEDLGSLVAIVETGGGAVRPNLILQEFVPGGSEAIWFFHGYFDGDSRCIAGFVGQKLREHPPGVGLTTLGVCRRNETVRKAAVDLLGSIGYQGLVDMEFRFDARTGHFLLVDLNPRIGANFRLLVGANGIDVARAFYLDLTGQPVPVVDPPDGRRWCVESLDPATWSAYFGRDAAPWRELLASLRGVEELAWFAHDDLVPFVVMAARRSRDLVRRVGTSIRAPRSQVRSSPSS